MAKPECRGFEPGRKINSVPGVQTRVSAGNPIGPAIKFTGEMVMANVVEEEKEIHVSEHVLVPKHEVLGNDERNQLLKKFNITEQQLPKAFVTDPAVKEIGAKVGEIVKITRKSQTAGKTVYYRLVIGGGHGE